MKNNRITRVLDKHLLIGRERSVQAGPHRRIVISRFNETSGGTRLCDDTCGPSILIRCYVRLMVDFKTFRHVPGMERVAMAALDACAEVNETLMDYKAHVPLQGIMGVKGKSASKQAELSLGNTSLIPA